ncbi:MAG: hypothetical protein KJ728_01075 [Alphaproteobacteria bacterium]|uniref:Uncharacterized protein n=2 Tax=Brevundimonas mediterranea TaxID=74329 RepID=A0A7Z9C5K6_9CAUL|nr:MULTISPECIES: hypothetical protein [unclassified Brevundimonas]MBU1519996.1 hypothetical protein [Alphaproteobacteria bacterium]VDC49981.1 hypothetical protein BREV_BREV_01630 [Brevundimonas mediterranea]KDP93943.1 hypothetical protein ER13_15105 [Brevundimonas sp. EAKA]MBJ7318866.1 hypothetical protein [Brevundimonas sp.]MBU2029758.1 hypothetical protein [Alphaproteobacteria bacterium]
MSISSVSSFLGSVGSVGQSASAGQNKPTSVLQNDLDQIREKGLSAWAHEQQMEKLKARLREQVLSDKNMSERDVAALPKEARATIEDEIAKLVAQKLQEALEAKVKDAAAQGKTQAVLLNISV